jgi:predicted DNA-binding transcriptional regulator AlpA
MKEGVKGEVIPNQATGTQKLMQGDDVTALLARLVQLAERFLQLEKARGGDVLLNVTETCRFFGGNEKPIARNTLYRGVAEGRFPRPIKIGPKTTRWRRSECEAALIRKHTLED